VQCYKIMEFKLNTFHRNISDEDLINDLKRVAKNIDKKKLTQNDYKENGGKYSLDTYYRRFRSWFEAVDRAGLQRGRTPMNIPVKKLFENLISVWTKLERQPTYNEMRKPLSKFNASTYEKRFGTWRKALENFVKFVNDGEIEIEQKKNTNSQKQKSQSSRYINIRKRFKVMREDNFKCRICGKSPATDPSIILHVDHIKPWSKGGENVLDNLQTLCSVCNIGKSDLDMQQL